MQARSRVRIHAGILVLLFASLSVAGAKLSLAPTVQPSGTVLIRLEPGAATTLRGRSMVRDVETGLPELDTLGRKHRIVRFEAVVRPSARSHDAEHPVFRWYRIVLPAEPGKGNRNTAAAWKRALADYRVAPGVERAEPTRLFRTTTIPDDPRFPEMWSLDQQSDADIDAPEAWDITTGDPSIVIAVVDTGVDWNHPDLAANIWSNPGEIPDNGLDDDANGYVDDIRGWDFNQRHYYITPPPLFFCVAGPIKGGDNDPSDDRGHGTHVAGILGAVGNNLTGVTGVHWTPRIMPARFLNTCGFGESDAGAEALVYAADNGADVINNSWGCGGGTEATLCFDPLIEDAVDYAHSAGVVVVSAAGNETGLTITAHPASARGSVAVGATDSTDQLAAFSNFGARTDVTAPGVNILSAHSADGWMCTDATGAPLDYCSVQGTSMAAPHAAGLASLLLSVNPGLGPEEIRQLLRATSDDLGDPGRDDSFAYGRINARQAVVRAQTGDVLAPYIRTPGNAAVLQGIQVAVTGDVQGADLASWVLEVGESDRTGSVEPATWTVIGSGTSPVVDGTLATWTIENLADGHYTMRLTAIDGAARNYEYEAFGIELDNLVLEVTTPTVNDPPGAGIVDILGTAASMSAPFLGYSIQWGAWSRQFVDGSWRWVAPQAFSSSGITVEGGGTVQVFDDRLATWDVGALATGYYSLRLTGRNTELIKIVERAVFVDRELAPGWPIAMDLTEDPALSDVDLDGLAEIVVGERGLPATLHALNADASEVPGWPVALAAPAAALSAWPRAPMLADFDGDGEAEIIVAVEHEGAEPWIHVLDRTGQPLPGWPIAFEATAEELGIPALADIAGDGSPELVVGHDGKLHAFDTGGAPLPGWPQTIGLFPRARGAEVSIGDLDWDGAMEVVAGFVDGGIWAFEADGTPVAGWPYHSPIRGQAIRAAPLLGPFHNGGFSEPGVVVHAAHTNENFEAEVWAVNLQTQQLENVSPLWDWALAPINSSVVVAELRDDNSLLEWAATSSTAYTAAPFPAHASCYDFGGQDSPTVGDADGDGRHDLVLTSWDGQPGADPEQCRGIQVNDGEGDTLFGRRHIRNQTQSGGVLADVNGDGLTDLIAAATDAWDIVEADWVSGSKLYLWNVGGPTDPGRVFWPMKYFDARHTNNRMTEESAGDPTVSLISPSDGATVSLNVLLSANATDDERVVGVHFLIDGEYAGSAGAAPFELSWDTRGATNGPHEIIARAVDGANRFALSTPITLTVNNATAGDTTAPTVSVSSPTGGFTYSGSLEFTATATDNQGVVEVQFFVDGELVGVDHTWPYSISWNTTSLPDGQHDLMVRAFDDAGNQADSPVIQVTTQNGISVAPGRVDGLLVAGFDPASGKLSITYAPPCLAADHNIVFGPLDQVSTYGYSGQECGIGAAGAYDQFLPGPGDWFFLVVATDALLIDGSYGLDGTGNERPEDLGDPVCIFTQDLSSNCDTLGQ